MFHHLKFYPELFISWRRKWQPTPVFLPGKSHGQRNVAGLQSMGSRRIRHDWMTSLIHFHKLRVSDLRIMQICLSSVQFSRSVVSDSLWSHGLQHTRPPCPSPTPRVYSNSCPWSRWCHPTISSSVVPFSYRLQFFPASFSNESVLCSRWPKYWSFSFKISPSSEYSGLISFRMDWLDLLAVPRKQNIV